jgi:hypothetical protein
MIRGFLTARLERIPRTPSIDEWLADHEIDELDLTPQPSHIRPSTEPLDYTAKVCNIAELREMILAHLLPLEIVRATAVSRSFYQLIHTSPTLQRKTFMRPQQESLTLRLKPTAPTQYCELMQWGRRLDQRHIRILPPTPNLVANDTPSHNLATPEGSIFNPIIVLHRHAVPITSLCPLLEPSDDDNDDGSYWRRQLHSAAIGIPDPTVPVVAMARFNKRAVQATEPWTNMQISSPPTHKAAAKIVWEGRIRGKLRVQLSGQTCAVQRDEGITFDALVEDASSSTAARGTVEIFTAVRCCKAHKTVIDWVFSTESGVTPTECMRELEQEKAYTWSVSTWSEVHFEGIVTPTEGEVRRLAKTDQLSSTPVPMRWHAKRSREEETAASVPR